MGFSVRGMGLHYGLKGSDMRLGVMGVVCDFLGSSAFKGQGVTVDAVWAVVVRGSSVQA